MLGILYQYLVDSQKGGMGWDGTKAASIVGSYIALVYFTPFLGGIIADRLLGCRITIVLGGIAMAIGHILLAFPTEPMLYLALLALIIGNGLFKPNISTLVGNLYPKGSPLKDAGYNIFYMGINIGAFICNFVAAVVRNKYGWHWAFATAGFGMLLGLVVFLSFQKHVRHADIDPRKSTEPRESLTPLWVRCMGPAVVLGAIGWFVGGYPEPPGLLRLGPATTAFIFACVPVVGFYVWIWRSLQETRERSRVAGLLVIYGVVVVFWMIFHQNSTALTEWAVHSTDRTVSSLTQPIVSMSPDFAENAPPEYYKNASPETPRPNDATFNVVTPERYKELKDEKALSVDDGKQVYVTETMREEIMANAGSERMPANQHLKLVNAELFQSINPALVILFTPLVVGVFAGLRRRGKEPSTSAKIGLGLALTAASALVMWAAVVQTNDAALKASPAWLWGTTAVITFGELCLSPMGLSLVNKMAPAKIRAFMMGGWFLSTAIGNKLSGVFGEVYHSWDHRTFFIVNAVACGAAAAATFALLPWLKRQMGEENEPERVPAKQEPASAA
jgi:POT family proton-dependent oligopeptide transporter